MQPHLVKPVENEDASEGGDPIAVTRSRFAAEVKANGISVAAAAREIGVSSATASLFMRGVYSGDNKMVARQIKSWLTTRADRKALGLHLDAHADLAVTSELMTDLATAQASADCLVVHGCAGAGKTYALRKYAESRSNVVVATMSPAVGTPMGVLSRLARVLHVGSGAANAAALEDVLVERLSGRGALLVIDEAHHLRPALLDEVRILHDRAGCGLALVGNDPLWPRLAGSERAAQIVSRVGIRRRLGSPSQSDLHTLASALLGRELGRKERSVITSMGRRAGGLRAVAKSMRDAHALARAEGRSCPSADDVAGAASLRDAA